MKLIRIQWECTYYSNNETKNTMYDFLRFYIHCTSTYFSVYQHMCARPQAQMCYSFYTTVHSNSVSFQFLNESSEPVIQRSHLFSFYWIRCQHKNTFSKILFNHQYWQKLQTFRPQKVKKRINNSSFNKENVALNRNLFKKWDQFCNHCVKLATRLPPPPTSTQLKCIKNKISCSNLADLKYTSLVQQKYNCRVFSITRIWNKYKQVEEYVVYLTWNKCISNTPAAQNLATFSAIYFRLWNMTVNHAFFPWVSSF